MSDDALAAEIAEHRPNAGGMCVSCPGRVWPCLVKRLADERDWVKAAVTTNQDVCEGCAAEIARAVGWEDG